MTEDISGRSKTDSVALNDEEQVFEILLQSVFCLWDVVTNLTRLTPTRRSEFRVSIFGSARVPQDHWVHGAVRDLARQLALMGCAVITGGGLGLMEAANEGAALAGAPASNMGIRVHLLFEQKVNPFVDESYEHRTFFTRLHHFVLASDAFVVVPGGIGTVLELSTIWQLFQVRKVLNEMPLILVGKLWADFVLGRAATCCGRSLNSPHPTTLKYRDASIRSKMQLLSSGRTTTNGFANRLSEH